MFCCGLFTGLPAISVGVSARRELRAAAGAIRGDGIAIGGIITGALGTLWSLVAGGILVALLVLGVQVANDYGDTCERQRDGRRTDDPFLGETRGAEDCG